LLFLYSDKAEEVLEFTHCDPPENYYITSDDMIGKSGVWAHFGSWNFDKALIYNTLKKSEYKKSKEKSIEYLKNRFNYSDSQAENLYYEVRSIKDSDAANSWIAPWPGYGSQPTMCNKISETELICPIRASGIQGTINMDIDLENYEAAITTPQGTVNPNAIIFPTEQGLVKKTYSNQTLGYSMTMIPNGDQWGYVMMIPPLEDSMFTRLYFLDGHGLSKFEKFSDQQSVIGNRIVVWKVKWNGDEPIVHDSFIEEEIQEITEETKEDNEKTETIEKEDTIEITEETDNSTEAETETDLEDNSTEE
jgi:dolichyl-diphosphooligosaccharide--protein glycosyltransferase